MDSEFNAKDITVGYHPDGYRIDKTALPMNRYTMWDIKAGGDWCNPRAVCFDSLPQKGWIEVDKFDWNDLDMNRVMPE